MNMPPRIKALPLDEHNRPVPWFVDWIDGKPDFRVADGDKLVRAIKEKRCWVCGEKLGRRQCFVLGPMCAINRTTAEPPAHLECARYSVQACPFLSTPCMHRRERDLPGGLQPAGGIMIRRNPGVTLLWVTHGYQLFGDGAGGVLLHIGEPVNIEFWRQGRAATREELFASIASGMPALEAAAAGDIDPKGAMKELKAMHEKALRLMNEFLLLPGAKVRANEHPVD